MRPEISGKIGLSGRLSKLGMYLPPLNTGADDTPRFAEAVARCAGDRPLILGSEGIWQWKTNLQSSSLGPGGFPSNTTLYLAPGYQHLCTLITGTLEAIPFFSGVTYSATTTTLFAPTVAGSRTISVSDEVLAGSIISIGSRWTLCPRQLRVLTSTAVAGHWDLIVDRPLDYVYPIAFTVTLLTSIPKNIRIQALGVATMRGQCDKHVLLSGVDDFLVENLTVEIGSGVGEYTLACDHDCRNGGFRNCHIKESMSGGSWVGFMLEGSEDVYAEDCTVQGAGTLFSYGIWSGVRTRVYNCLSLKSKVRGFGIHNTNPVATPYLMSIDCSWDRCVSSGSDDDAFYIGGQSVGTQASMIVADRAIGAGVCGIRVAQASSGTRISQARITNSTNGLITDYSAGAVPTDTIFYNLTTDHITDYGIREEADLKVYGWKSSNSGGSLIALTSPSNFVGEGLDLTDTANPSISIEVGGTFSFSGKMDNQTLNANLIHNLDTATVKCHHLIQSCNLAGAGVAYRGIANCTLIDGEMVDRSGVPSAFYPPDGVRLDAASCHRNLIDVTLTENTPLAIPCRSTKSNDIVSFETYDMNGSTATSPIIVTKTPGTGISVVSVVGDTRKVWCKIGP